MRPDINANCHIYIDNVYRAAAIKYRFGSILGSGSRYHFSVYGRAAFAKAELFPDGTNWLISLQESATTISRDYK